MEHEFEVALSFAGPERVYVEEVARILREAGVRVFYDDFEAERLWGEDLAVHFDQVYRRSARYVVPFISHEYAERAWPRHEFRSALARAVTEREAYILPVRFDDTELPGLRPTIGYLDAQKLRPADIAQRIMAKLGRAVDQAAAPATPVARLPRVVPQDFNPYAEAERCLAVLRSELTARSEHLTAQGFVTNVRDRDGRFQLRVMRGGAPIYGLDIWLGDGGFGDNALCFCDGRTGPSSPGSMTASGKVEWDAERGAAVVKLLNFSLLPQMAAEYRLTADELANAIWDEACHRIEQNVRM